MRRIDSIYTLVKLQKMRGRFWRTEARGARSNRGKWVNGLGAWAWSPNALAKGFGSVYPRSSVAACTNSPILLMLPRSRPAQFHARTVGLRGEPIDVCKYL